MGRGGKRRDWNGKEEIRDRRADGLHIPSADGQRRAERRGGQREAEARQRRRRARACVARSSKATGTGRADAEVSLRRMR